MIFIPEENVDIRESDTHYYYHWNRSDGNDILFLQEKLNPEQVYIENINYRYCVLPCPEIACRCEPQLHYNSIAKKFFMVCPSSLICTTNNEQAEYDFIIENSLSLFDDAFEAVINWNIEVAQIHLEIARRRFSKGECPPGANCDFLDSTPDCTECWGIHCGGQS